MPPRATMTSRKRPISELATTEIVTSEPALLGEGKFSTRHKVKTYPAVDYLGTRFRVGDHVAMYTGEGREWVCILETLYKDPADGQAKFKGRWFWNVPDIRKHKGDDGEPMRASKFESHELICCDNRDKNLVESISRKCTILSFENFMLVKKAIVKPDSMWKKTYFCERQYYHKAHRFSELNGLLFPGDPIPPDLRRAAGLPKMEDTELEEDAVDYTEAYQEPEFAVRSKRKGRSDKGSLGEPVLIW